MHKLLILLALSGCASADFTNRPVCTLPGDSAYIISFWKFFGIATEIDKRDVAVICKKS